MRLRCAVPLLVLLTGCGALVGLDTSYSVADAGLDASPPLAEGSAPPGRDSAVDARSRTDASRDQASPPRDGQSPHDAVSLGDAPSPQGDADSCVDQCGCPTGMTQCGTQCVDLSSDMNHCGACGNPCAAASPSTAVCAAARCIVTLASSGGPGAGITVDATSVYWADGVNVLKVPLGGGDMSTLVVAEGSFQVAVTPTSLYWTSFDGIVGEVSLDGSMVATLVSTQEPTPPPFFLALDSSSLYWTTQTDNTIGTVVKMPLSAPGSFTTLATGQALSEGIGVANGTVFWADETTVSPNVGTIMSTPAATGTVSVVATVDAPHTVAVDGTNIYWTSAAGAVVKAPQGGGSPVTLAPGNVPNGIAVDGESVYWADTNGGALMKVAIGGGTPTTLASTSAPQFVAVDGTSVYWTTSAEVGNPNVFRITPK
jgi:hypothetical protein